MSDDMQKPTVAIDNENNENNGSERIFSSSIFRTVEQMDSAGVSPDKMATFETPKEKPEEAPIILEYDDIRGLLEAPFDFMAWRTKFPGWKLREEQTQRLCKLWLKPMTRLCAKVKNVDVILAAISTFEVVLEKQGDYAIEHNNRTRNERQGENELLEKQIV